MWTGSLNNQMQLRWGGLLHFELFLSRHIILKTSPSKSINAELPNVQYADCYDNRLEL